jgi:hypothetical protein
MVANGSLAGAKHRRQGKEGIKMTFELLSFGLGLVAGVLGYKLLPTLVNKLVALVKGK